jgi:hypothetical protein
LKALFERVSIVSKERQIIYDAIERLNKEIGDAETKRGKAEKKVHPKYNKIELLEKGIK